VVITDAGSGSDGGVVITDAGSGSDGGGGGSDAGVPDRCVSIVPTSDSTSPRLSVSAYPLCPPAVDLGDADVVNLPDVYMVGNQFGDNAAIGTYTNVSCVASSSGGVTLESAMATFLRVEFDNCLPGFDPQGTITLEDQLTGETETFSIAEREARNVDLGTFTSTSNHVDADPDIGSVVRITSMDRNGNPQPFAIIDAAVGMSRAQQVRVTQDRAAETLFSATSPTFGHLQATDMRPTVAQPYLGLTANLNQPSSPNRVRGEGVQRIAFADNTKPTKVEAVCTADAIADGTFVWTNAHCIMNLADTVTPHRPMAQAIAQYILQSSYWVVAGGTLRGLGQAPDPLTWNWANNPVMGSQALAGPRRNQAQGASLVMTGGDWHWDYTVFRIPTDKQLGGVSVFTAALPAGYFTTQGNTRVQINQYPNGMPQQFGDRSAVPTSAILAVNVTNGGAGYTAAPAVNFVGGGQIAGGTPAAATAVIAGGVVTRINLTNPGSGYTDRPTITLTGGGGAGATGNVDFRSGNGVASLTVTAGGTGYTAVPTVTIAGGGGAGATATATLTGGVVTGITLTNPGTGYTTVPAVDITGGGGAGARATAVLGSSFATFLTPIYGPLLPSGAANPDADAVGLTNDVWYSIDTMGGSSGSQILGSGGAQQGQLVALHHAGTVLGGVTIPGINEAIRVDVILPDRGLGRNPANFMVTWVDAGGIRPEHPTAATDTTTVQQAMAGHL
jgi:hypothetical protein